MNKKNIFIIAVVIIVALIIWLLVAFLNVNRPKDNTLLNPEMNNTPTAQEAINLEAPFLKKIEVEFMTPEEKEKMDVADNPSVRLQVLERDAEGNATVYKKVTSDEEVVEYVYDPANPSGELIVAPLGQR